ncbi:MAG TPA: dihydrofolate reductase family protein [Actinomycetota bacterium]|nr:dihydrofolate reductase family protein [Actinomycetota bacterium]
MTPLELLYEPGGLPTYDLPEELERLYGGGIGFEAPRLFANFVSSLDGVVSIEGEAHSGRMLSGRSEADHFMMGLLRACADAVVIGAGTLRPARRSLWTPDYIYPEAATAFAELRKRLGRDEQPRLVVITARGDLEPGHPALEAGALVLTPTGSAAGLRERLPAASIVVAMGDGARVDLVDAMALLRGEGYATVLTEGGPTVVGGLLRSGLLDELFLTLSPVLAGRSAGTARPGFIDAIDLLPSRSIAGDLIGLRRQGSHLFLRYSIPRGS